MRYLTINYRKDKRVTIGTRIHKDPQCSTVTNVASLKPVTGEILKIIPRCKTCFGKGNK